MIADHLAQAEQHVAEARVHVKRQREIVAELQRDGHDTREAQRLLDNFIALERSHAADRDRLRDQLAKAR
jgi:hypothetical protein